MTDEELEAIRKRHEGVESAEGLDWQIEPADVAVLLAEIDRLRAENRILSQELRQVWKHLGKE